MGVALGRSDAPVVTQRTLTEGAAHVRFARKMQRVKTITRSALKKHRSRVRHLKENSGKMADDLTLARSKLGNRYGADGIDDSQTDADGRARKELKRPVTVFSRFRPFRSNVGELPAQGETPTYSIDPVVDDSGEEISKLNDDVEGMETALSRDERDGATGGRVDGDGDLDAKEASSGDASESDDSRDAGGGGEGTGGEGR